MDSPVKDSLPDALFGAAVNIYEFGRLCPTLAITDKGGEVEFFGLKEHRALARFRRRIAEGERNEFIFIAEEETDSGNRVASVRYISDCEEIRHTAAIRGKGAWIRRWTISRQEVARSYRELADHFAALSRSYRRRRKA